VVNAAVGYCTPVFNPARAQKRRSWMTPELAKLVSPYLNVDGDSAPIHLIHRTADRTVPIRNSYDLKARCESFGVPVSLEVLDGKPHVFYTNAESADKAYQFFKSRFEAKSETLAPHTRTVVDGVDKQPAKPVLASSSADLRRIDNGFVQIGIDCNRGAAITWLSWRTYPKNMINIADPGRLIQQSYYAGKRLDRRTEGQSRSWSPWPWNPIQGGGVGSWARVTEFRKDGNLLYAETIPKLWDMPDEEADARMRQWTTFEPAMPNVVVVRCEFVSRRDENDRWGPAEMNAQEIPACYFTRNFSDVKSYLGDGKWRDESQPPGPPWGRANPPRRAMAVFEEKGRGVAVFSPSSIGHWNFGPHGKGLSDDSLAGPCMHVAPLDRVEMGPRTTYSYRYWLIAGDQAAISARLDSLWEKYSNEKAKCDNPPKKRGPESSSH